MKVKKLISGVLALGLAMSMGLTAFAAAGDTTVSKVYKLTNADTVSPAETFSFSKLDFYKVTDAAAGITDVPKITLGSASYDEGTATVDGTSKSVSFTVDGTWPSVGIYYYSFTETAGSTLGVTYSDQLMVLKVTVSNGTAGLTPTFAIYQASKNEKGEIVTDKKVNTVTNEYSAGSLAVSKTVTGNLGDKTRDFQVTVTFKNTTGKTVASTISYTDSGKEGAIAPSDWSNGTATAKILLKDGETVTFTNIPYGVTYGVAENDYSSDGYSTTYSFDDSKKTVDSAKDTVAITNNKDTTIDTGINLDSLPYIMMLAIAGVGLVVFAAKKRSMRED